MISDANPQPARTALAQLSLEASMMASGSTASRANGKSANPPTNEELLAQLKKEAADKLNPLENEFLTRQSQMAVDLLQMSARTYDIRQSLAEFTTCLELQIIQYALIKHDDIENYKAQIETYKSEVDLLRQENYELSTQMGVTPMACTPSEESEVNGSEA